MSYSANDIEEKIRRLYYGKEALSRNKIAARLRVTPYTVRQATKDLPRNYSILKNLPQRARWWAREVEESFAIWGEREIPVERIPPRVLRWMLSPKYKKDGTIRSQPTGRLSTDGRMITTKKIEDALAIREIVLTERGKLSRGDLASHLDLNKTDVREAYRLLYETHDPEMYPDLERCYSGAVMINPDTGVVEPLMMRTMMPFTDPEDRIEMQQEFEQRKLEEYEMEEGEAYTEFFRITEEYPDSFPQKWHRHALTKGVGKHLDLVSRDLSTAVELKDWLDEVGSGPVEEFLAKAKDYPRKLFGCSRINQAALDLLHREGGEWVHLKRNREEPE